MPGTLQEIAAPEKAFVVAAKGFYTEAMKIGVAGCSGRMGTLIVREILSGRWPGLELAGGSVKPGFPAPEGFFGTHDPDVLFTRSDAVIDFTEPEAAQRHIWLAAKHRKPYVLGTTGLGEAAEKELADAAREAPILYAANMSVGVTLLGALVEKAAAALGPEWDIEIFESHHRHKIDAPSGTALALGRAAAHGRGRTHPDFTYARQGRTGERPAGTIGFSVARGGDVAGEHTVFFFGQGERIELAHRAADRALFAQGALRAAQWLENRAPGLYTMRDVLGL